MGECITFFILQLYLRSPAAYEALKSFKLPCQSTLKAYTCAFMHDPGARSDCIVDQVSHYVTSVLSLVSRSQKLTEF